MKKYVSPTQGFFYLGVLLLCSFLCNGQEKKVLSKQNEKESIIIPFGQLKLKKSPSTGNGHNVHWSIQDKAGNLWFGTTADGIFKYDASLSDGQGKPFSQFTVANGLNSNSVNCIFEDSYGKIWIGTDKGACIYHENKITQIEIAIPTEILSKKEVWCIMKDKGDKLWFATINGVYIYDGISFTRFKVTEDTRDCYYKMEYILEDKTGNIWFGGRCNAGVFRYDGSSIINLRPNGDDWAWPVLQDKKGNIWFSNWKGTYRYDGTSFTTFTKNDGLCGDVVTRIMEDRKGNLWIGGGGGISHYDGNTFTCFSIKDGLFNDDIWSILEDKTGNIWIGTRGTMLHRYDGKSFINFSE